MSDRPNSDPQPTPTTPGEETPPAQSRRLGRLLNDTLDQLKGRLSNIPNIGDVTKLFSVNDEQLAEILARVREELPTTEALLLGKPQAGKSSIVRGLTGVSAEIIGQGFRPHTQNTQRYAYPSEELPLLVFTDTVGLGDTRRDTQELVSELLDELDVETRRARIVILTVRITDFATDTLQDIVRQLRQQHPEIPCLLAITCLHELYPPSVVDHPDYPPEFEEIQRVSRALEASFASWYDGVVWLDFTLEDDGFTPVFYGLEALRDAIADLLPQAEAQAIHELLAEGTTQELGDLYRDVGRRYILAFSVMAATLAAVPLPFATMPVLTALQVSLVGVIGRLYGQTLSPSQAGGVVSAIAGGFLAQLVGRELVKFIPGLGSALAASWAAAYTWALGEGACVYFGDLMGGKTPDPQKIQATMNEAFEAAKKRFRDHKNED